MDYGSVTRGLEVLDLDRGWRPLECGTDMSVVQAQGGRKGWIRLRRITRKHFAQPAVSCQVWNDADYLPST